MMLSQKLMFNPSSGVWFWDGTITLTGKLSHLRILILVFDFLLDWITSCELGFPHDFPWFTLDWITSCKLGFSLWFPVIYCWIESHPVNWVFPLISRDLLNWIFPVIYNWIKSCPVNWVLPLDFPWFNHILRIGFFLLISCDLLLDWITSCELSFSPDFPWFTLGFFLRFPVISCWIESHLVN